MIDLSLVVTIYNNTDYLRFVLFAIARQRYRDAEVVIADDGSGPEIAEVIKNFGPTFPFPIRHNWHEDRGWWNNVIMNALSRRVLHSRVRRMLENNFSAVRDHIIAIFGFDEEYDGQDCGEGGDVQFWLELPGSGGKSIRHLAIQYHLCHPRTVVCERNTLRDERDKRERRVGCAIALSVDELLENMTRP